MGPIEFDYNSTAVNNKNLCHYTQKYTRKIQSANYEVLWFLVSDTLHRKSLETPFGLRLRHHLQLG